MSPPAIQEFRRGRKVARICMYGPADTEFRADFWDMEVVHENGQPDNVPWVRCVNKANGEVWMVNCAKCACIMLAEDV